MAKKRPRVKYLLERDESRAHKPCLESALRRHRARAKVTITRDGYLAIWPSDKGAWRTFEGPKGESLLASVERECKL